jgi:hypothetical protein
MKIGIVYASYEDREAFASRLEQAIAKLVSAGHEAKVFRENGIHLGRGKNGNEWSLADRLIVKQKYKLVGNLRNIGIQKALDWGSDYVLILDDDVILKEDTILKFIAFAQKTNYPALSCITLRPLQAGKTEYTFFNAYDTVRNGITPSNLQKTIREIKTSRDNCASIAFVDEIYFMSRKLLEDIKLFGDGWFYCPVEFKLLGIPPIESQEIHGFWLNVRTFLNSYLMIDEILTLYNPHINGDVFTEVDSNKVYYA